MNSLHALDLNLLLVLHVVLEEGSATRAARRLHVSQSAVSNALARARERLGDPLFVRRGHGLVPTPAAEAMRGELAAAVRHLEHAMERVAPFEAASTDRCFRIRMADYQMVVDLPPILRRLRAVAPSARVDVSGVAMEDEVDLCLTPIRAVQDDHHRPVYTEPSALIARPGVPPLSLQDVERRAHVHVGSASADVVGRAFAEAGVRRHVVLTVPNFYAGVRPVLDLDLLCLVPLRMAEAVAADGRLSVHVPPFPTPSVPIHLVWTARTDGDAGSRFFRELVLDVLSAHPDRGTVELGPE